MRAAFAAIRHGAWLRGAPVVERVGPLLRAAHVVQLDARVDDAAVDDAGDDRHQLAGSDGDHHLVEERQAVGCLSEANQRTAAALAREVHDIDVAEPFADVLDIGEGRHRAGEITAGDLLEGVRQQDVAALDAVVLILIEQPAGAANPAGRARQLAGSHQHERHPECGARRARHLAVRQMQVVRACEEVDRVGIAAGEMGGHRLALQRVGVSARSRERRRLGHSVPRAIGAANTPRTWPIDSIRRGAGPAPAVGGDEVQRFDPMRNTHYDVAARAVHSSGGCGHTRGLR